MFEFFRMGGYGLYVWAAWAIGAIVIIANLFTASTKVQNAMAKAARDLEGNYK